MQIEMLLSKFEKVRKTASSKWQACCPAHNDKSPSLAIKLTDDDKILVKCFAGCSVQDIVAAVGLTLADLMPERPQGYDRTRAKIPRFNKFELFDRMAEESIILSLAVRQLLNGAALAPNDLQRIMQAEETINNIARECR